MPDHRPGGAAPRRAPGGVTLSRLALAAALGLLGGACSVKKFAVRQVADALASDGSVYERDSDIELVGGALPFSLKLVESLLDVTPRHRGLLVTAAKGFALYALAYVDTPGEILIEEDFERGRELRVRAKRLYLRSLAFSTDALERAYPGIEDQLRSSPREAAARVKRKDIDLLYWAGAALGLSISADTTDPRMLLRLGEVEALLDRAMELDEGWDRGTLHEFRLKLEAARPGGARPDVIESSFRRAAELSDGQRASLYVDYAVAAAIPSQNRELFGKMLDRALAIDADEFEQYRLLNLLAQRRAVWLRSRTDDLFF